MGEQLHEIRVQPHIPLQPHKPHQPHQPHQPHKRASLHAANIPTEGAKKALRGSLREEPLPLI